MTATPNLEAQIAAILAPFVNGAYPYNTQLGDIPAGRELLKARPEEQRAFVMAAVDWMVSPSNTNRAPWQAINGITPLLRRTLPFTHDDVLALLRWVQRSTYGWQVEPYVGKIVASYLANNPRTPALDAGLAELVAELDRRAWGADQRRRLLRLKELAGLAQAEMPLVVGDAWADAAIADVGALAPERRAGWAELLQHCAAAGGSTPGAKWQKAADALVERVGAAELRAALLRWFALVDKPRVEGVIVAGHYDRHPLVIHERNLDVLRALVWLCADADDRETARALGALAVSFYRKLPGVGPRSVRLGNAAIWALGQLPGQHGMAQLALLKTRIKLAGAQKQIAGALAAAAERAALPPDQVEELLVPTYGLTQVGLCSEQLGEVSVELVVDGSDAELRYTRADGKRLSAPPKAIRAEHGAALGELKQAAADIRAMLPAQRDRIEQLYLQRRSWPLATWRERYLDHPLVGAIARRLIWRFSQGDTHRAAIWRDGALVGVDGRELAGLSAQTQVALWHPLDSPTEEIMAWREWLAGHELRQPFKQAHREIYLLTDAERATRVYSNRFAAHVVRQHQFNALCAARGWKNQLRLMVDDSYPPAQRPLAAWGLRAEYWVEGVGDTYGTDTNDTGTYLRLITDQVRFYPIDTAQNYAHALGGGYSRYWHAQGPAETPVPLEQLPPLVLSEILRDIDLFVGVASVGNDPTWSDGGPEGRYRNYWSSYAFGDLSETARTRRAVLEQLVPRLKIGPRCQLTERFLVVRGDIRTYKIHLGSSNILMEPNDQYLCIVPARSAADGEGAQFIPFEGDGTLAIILSKALLLAEDTKISDPTITRQIGR